ncbi:MAG: RagB/SusD family nutrient uptake outer membrane protein [Mangrovibacterium sp.]
MKKGIFIIATLSLLLTSCNEWLTVQPNTMIAKDEMFETATGFEDALNGAYYLMTLAYKPSGPMMMGTLEYLACQWHVTSTTSGDYKMTDHDYDNDNADGQLKIPFEALYKTLANVNLLIEELRQEDGILTDKLKNSYLGQALAIRAYINFDLIRMWGPVPTDVNESTTYLPYPTETSIEYKEYLTYAQFMSMLKADLDEAEVCLNKDTMKDIQLVRSRFNYYAIKALQARYYMWMGDKDSANRCAKTVIGRATTTVSDYDYCLATHNNQTSKNFTFFECENIIGLVVADVQITVSVSSTSCQIYNEYIHNDVFDGSQADLRYSQWTEHVGTVSEEGLGYLMKLSKFYKKGSTGTYSVNTPLLRLAEMYLIQMECSSLEKAYEVYYEFCMSRGISATEFTSDAELLECLKKEYRREFYGEGQLFFFYKRQFITNMPNASRACNKGSYELPLPTREYILS